jgi:transcriptional regulator with XRE-family HTH domain
MTLKGGKMTLRELRVSKGFTLGELERKMGTTKQHLSYLENGIKNPSLKTANDLAKALGVGIEVIIECFDQKTAQTDG